MDDLRIVIARAMDDALSGLLPEDLATASEAVLTALREAGCLVEWRPIEEAPFNPEERFSNPRLLLACDDHVSIGRRDNEAFNSKPRPYWRRDSWLGKTHDRANEPTHFAALPQPPETNNG